MHRSQGAAAVGVITGMRAEARCLPTDNGGDPVWPRCSGARSDAAEAHARALIAAGARRLVSFGLAGGLDPGLATGTVVIPGWVQDGGVQWATDRARSDAVRTACARLGFAITGTMAGPVGIAGVDAPVAHAGAKSGLRARSGAVACDMESHRVARTAGGAGVPFTVVRVVADAAGTSIPPSALIGIGADGSVRPLAVLGAVCRDPSQIAGLWRAARDSGRAMAVLRRLGAAGLF